MAGSSPAMTPGMCAYRRVKPGNDRSLRRFRGRRHIGAGVQALGVDVAVDELDHRDRRVVAIAEAGLDDAGVAALAVLVADGQRIEQLADLILIAHLADRLPSHRKPPLLA